MKTETIVVAISFTCFGVLVGWILGTQQTPGPPIATASAASSAPASSGGSQQSPPLDVQRATELERQANSQPTNAKVRADLGDVYYDAGRFDQAATWYEASLKLDPNNVLGSTDLAVCYYNMNQVDKALAQLDHSLKVDPKHAKSLLNQGIIRAYGKSDLKGAVESWQRVVAVAPGSEEAQRAQQALNGIQSAHPGGTTTPGAGGRGGRP